MSERKNTPARPESGDYSDAGGSGCRFNGAKSKIGAGRGRREGCREPGAPLRTRERESSRSDRSAEPWRAARVPSGGFLRVREPFLASDNPNDREGRGEGIGADGTCGSRGGIGGN